jgi:cytochrome c
MKKLLVAVATTGLLTFGAAAQASGNVAAGKAVFQTCIGCHGAMAEGGVGPKLAGRKASFIVQKLHDFKAGKQMGPMTSMMAPMAAGLSDTQMKNVAAYLATL